MIVEVDILEIDRQEKCQGQIGLCIVQFPLCPCGKKQRKTASKKNVLFLFGLTTTEGSQGRLVTW